MFELHCVDGSDTNRCVLVFFGVFFMLTVEGYIFTISDVLLKEVSVSHVSVVASVFPGL